MSTQSLRRRPAVSDVSRVRTVPFVEPRDLAAMTGTSKHFVYKCLEAGTLSGVRIGHRIKIRQRDALAWLASVGLDA